MDQLDPQTMMLLISEGTSPMKGTTSKRHGARAEGHEWTARMKHNLWHTNSGDVMLTRCTWSARREVTRRPCDAIDEFRRPVQEEAKCYDIVAHAWHLKTVYCEKVAGWRFKASTTGLQDTMERSCDGRDQQKRRSIQTVGQIRERQLKTKIVITRRKNISDSRKIWRIWTSTERFINYTYLDVTQSLCCG